MRISDFCALAIKDKEAAQKYEKELKENLKQISIEQMMHIVKDTVNCLFIPDFAKIAFMNSKGYCVSFDSDGYLEKFEMNFHTSNEHQDFVINAVLSGLSLIISCGDCTRNLQRFIEMDVDDFVKKAKTVK